MASESRDDRAVSVDLPPAVDEWLEEEAAALGVDRADLVVQLLAAHSQTGSLEAGLDEHVAGVVEDRIAEDVDDAVDERVDDAVDERVGDAVEGRVDDAVADHLDDALEDHLETAVENAVEERLEAAVEERLEAVLDERLRTAGESRLGAALDEAVAERADLVADAVEERLVAGVVEDVGADVEALEADFQAKIEDVRERVIQVKRETDAKAPADHDHTEFRELAALERRLEDVAADLTALREDVDERLGAREEELAERGERLEDVEDKLRRVAWVVSDLRDDGEGQDAHERAVRRIKRAAAQEGIARADCDRCGESVHVALMTDPECPHCQATVADVRPEGGFFRSKARLVPAAQLESGEPGPEDGE